MGKKAPPQNDESFEWEIYNVWDIGNNDDA